MIDPARSLITEIPQLLARRQVQATQDILFLFLPIQHEHLAAADCRPAITGAQGNRPEHLGAGGGPGAQQTFLRRSAVPIGSHELGPLRAMRHAHGG